MQPSECVELKTMLKRMIIMLRIVGTVFVGLAWFVKFRGLMLEKTGVYITPEHCLVAAIG